MTNNKETDYLKLVRTPPQVGSEAIEWEIQTLKQASIAEKMRWRGIKTSTAVIAVFSLMTIAFTAIFLLTGAIISLL